MGAALSARGADSLFVAIGLSLILAVGKVGRNCPSCAESSGGLRLSNSLFAFLQNKASQESLTLLAVNIFARRERARAPLSNYERNGGYAVSNSWSKIHKLNTLMYLRAGCAS